MMHNTKTNRGLGKRIMLVMMLALACVLLSSCYTDPDRAFDQNTGLDLNGGATFQTVITNTPYITNTPTPGPTNTPVPQNTGNQIDWGNWDWNNGSEATTPPSNVVTSSPNNGGVINSGGINVNQSTIPPTNPPSNNNNDGSSGNNNGGSSGNSSGSSGSSSSSTTSSTTLRPGSSGPEVKKLQSRLKELKYYSGNVDGDYGAGTTAAVKKFQQNNNLKADGIAGPKTLEAVHSYYAVPATATGNGSGGGGSSSHGTSSGGSSSGGSSSGGSSSGGSSSGSSNANSYTNGRTDIYLKLGSSGAQVKIMQNRLIVLGYLTGTADGEFKQTTDAAVRAFQKRHGMYDDGVAGPDTLKKLYSSSAKKAESVVANLGSLRKGSQGAAVRALQKNLRTLGYYTGSVDGDYGDGTVAAVTAFQAANGLTADGIDGNGTQNAILLALNGGSSSGGGAGSGSGSGSGNNGSTSPVTYGSTATSNGYTTISSTNGNRANVTAVQSALSAMGFYSGALDGDYGAGTQDAVEDFQRSRGLRVTGMAGPTTQRLLYGGTSASGSYTKLEKGSSGSKVKSLQYALYELKYYDGNITGKYDDATESAVMLFQDCNGIDIDGVAGQMTQQLLYSSNAIPCNK